MLRDAPLFCRLRPARSAALAAAAIAVSACDTPSAQFAGAPVQRITVAGSDFDVRVADGWAEAIRTNAEWAPRRDSTLARALAAIELASGCAADRERIRGDQAVLRARLDCAAGAGPASPPPEFTCRPVRAAARAPEWVCLPPPGLPGPI